MKANCYECTYRGSVPSDAHSCCHHPEVEAIIGDDSGFGMIMALVGDPDKIREAAIKLQIEADHHGVRSGWFMWPANFDPCWLINCDGFIEK
jgi:hypothetical protein